MNETQEATQPARQKSRGGRPTRAAAALRDERLLGIATEMFLQSGFDGVSMDRLAEAAMIGKATLYARYSDKAALFADVLRRRILSIYGPLEQELEEELSARTAMGTGARALEETLLILARRFLQNASAPESIALGRILSAQAERFPDLGKLAVREGLDRQARLVETILIRFSSAHRYAVDDMALAADLFLSIILGRISKIALLGVRLDAETLDRRAREAVRIYVRGLLLDRPCDAASADAPTD